MESIAAIVATWITEGRSGAMARVIGPEGLGPRPAGDILVIGADGRTEGALLGGAARPDVIAAARHFLESGANDLVVALDIDFGDATAAGLTGGGLVEILLQRLDAIPTPLWSALAAGRPAALVTAPRHRCRTDDGRPRRIDHRHAREPGLDSTARSEAQAMLGRPGSSSTRLGVGPIEIVIESWNAVPHLLIVGASDLSIALTRQAELLGWTAATTVEADGALAATADLSVADAVVVIDHDPAVATPVLAAALQRGIGYVGALGSRRTQQTRRQHLTDRGLSSVEIDRLHGPTGLDIGARSPAETAVSIVAEIIAGRSARTGAALTTTTGKLSG